MNTKKSRPAHIGYLLLFCTWANFGMLLSSLAGMYLRWNLKDNIVAIAAIAAVWLCNFTFTLKDARALNEQGRESCNRP